ncbi:hypothetical protein RvY_14428 [Ramazzottius varieornatus]|uniref:Cdc23 domain-containing protein n=1 Tax=Ramazzottius varieornatus TaxID=947166 RepID=A0A1D1VT94_RAMVA|nr:hypothetical protein RvY_14428 [Ramazzottius varieornatus]
MAHSRHSEFDPLHQTGIPNIADDIRYACTLCTNLHLGISAQWASTALLSYREPTTGQHAPLQDRNIHISAGWLHTPGLQPATSTPLTIFKVRLPPAADAMTPLLTTTKEPAVNALSESLLDPVHNLAHSAMNLRKYKEVIWLTQGKTASDPLLRFLNFFSRHLHTERTGALYYTRNDMDAFDKKHFAQIHDKLLSEIADHFEASRAVKADAPLLFLFGKLLRKRNRTADAIKAFVEAIVLEPAVLESWLELSEVLENRSEILKVSSSLPDYWFKQFFLGKAFAHIGLVDRALEAFENFQNLGFHSNPDLNNAMGKLLMTIDPDHSLSFMESARLFNPLRINDVDSYSHLLFIIDDHVRMRKLAGEIYLADRFTAESSIALGNFYGLLGEHDKAVVNFLKALRYNPELHHVWTLIGHEQVELKQTDLAMRSYHNAVEANPKEYRAWYGLGQTLEILRAHSSALYYFKKAFEYCPNDTRMLLALGDTFQILENNIDAERCYWRSYQVDGDTIALVRLARLFEKLGRYGRAAELYVKYTADIQSHFEEQLGSLADRDDAEDLGHAYLYLSKYYLLHRLFDNAFQEAQAAEVFRDVKDEAHAMLKQISRMRAESTDHVDEQGESIDIDPARLGFPLWKEPILIETVLRSSHGEDAHCGRHADDTS